VEPAGHQVVHEVIAFSNGGKDLVYEALALGFGYVSKPERRLVSSAAALPIVGGIAHAPVE
jgi:hypothetical protein